MVEPEEGRMTDTVIFKFKRFQSVIITAVDAKGFVHSCIRA